MKNHALTAACFALWCCAISLAFGLLELCLLLFMNQGLPAAGLLAAGVAGYAAGRNHGRRTEATPAGLPLVVHLAVMAAVLMGLTYGQPLLLSAIFGDAAPLTPLMQVPAEVRFGLTLAGLCLTLATFRAGARHWLERENQAGRQPA
ncbi:hypothetical protein [Oceanicola sp. 502str15]|uniref:hypothetical protein n=1 Tax=Oceanicola sp. 502str15 TaxID=2696061 RepID=UPI00209507F1|nr:hypothetical protein [Oceanicola sp. 502str15]MCO6381936.1 hypothetical protein [Oceanicola sp. 502str15]